jgi:hypothetical protein
MNRLRDIAENFPLFPLIPQLTVVRGSRGGECGEYGECFWPGVMVNHIQDSGSSDVPRSPGLGADRGSSTGSKRYVADA